MHNRQCARRALLTLELLVSYHITEAPVPVERLAKAKGARIFYQSLEGDVSGFLYRDAAQAVIGVNTHHAPVRQTFTTAHELGHLLLHDQEQLHIDHGFRVRLRDDMSSQGTDDAERNGRGRVWPWSVHLTCPTQCRRSREPF
jgi:Zn-dependent peptidase ImmA (M78 family)